MEAQYLGNDVFRSGRSTGQQASSTHPSSHRQTPQHHHRRASRSTWPRPSLPRHLYLLFLLTCIFTVATASIYVDISEEMVEGSSIEEAESLGSTFARLARSGTIIVDPNPPPVPKDWALDDTTDLRRRTNNASSPSSTTKTSSTVAGTTSSSSSPVATGPPAALPSPFDTGFNNNITASCASFMSAMLSNSTFKSCLPFSLLLQNSNSFFQASKSLVRITQTLDTSCAANLTLCTNLLTSLAQNLTQPTSCSSDLSSQNPIITQAHLGLLSYRTLYTASCLRNPLTSSYCFADAITNASNPTDSYIYFLPLNVSLVGGSQPTCDACLKNTMEVFEAATAERNSAIAQVYGAAAGQVNVNCGPGFVNQSLAAAVVNGASPAGVNAWPGWILLVVMGVWMGWLL